jgi:hypothetical protein
MAKLVTKGRLIEAMEGGRTEGYNHLIDEAVINSLDPAHHYPVLAAIPHKHKQGERSRAHTRLLVEIKTRSGQSENLLIDVSEDLFGELPEADE